MKTLRGAVGSSDLPLASIRVPRRSPRSLDMPGWEEDLQRASAMARGAHPAVIAAIDSTSTVTFIFHGMRIPDAAAVRRSGDLLSLAEQTGEDFAFRWLVRFTHKCWLTETTPNDRLGSRCSQSCVRRQSTQGLARAPSGHRNRNRKGLIEFRRSRCGHRVVPHKPGQLLEDRRICGPRRRQPFSSRPC